MIHPLIPRRSHWLALAVTLGSVLLAGPNVAADEPPAKSLAQKTREIAGTAEFLRAVPKRHAILTSVDAPRRRVVLLIEGESLAKQWDVATDAEVKIAGWWGRLGQLTRGDRVWVWFQTARQGQPTAVSMLADELSEQDMHGAGVTVAARTDTTLTVKPAAGPNRTLSIQKAEYYHGRTKGTCDQIQVGDKIYLQSTASGARLILDAAALEARRAEQKAALRRRWLKDGLPGTVVFLHRFSGEMELMLDHEAMRWGRTLRTGDKVTLPAQPPIPALVKQVQPWRERTQVRLVVAAADQADLHLGQRVHLRREAPPAEVDAAELPPDLDRPRSREERIEWFLASIYCTCKIANDTCTGQFYTLASCNPNGCGMPHHMRQVLADKIAKGLTDKQIFEELLKEHGPGLLRPHLLP
jgi:hypothetical protein